MNAVGNRCEVRHDQGFQTYVLSNAELEVAVIPELGAKIVSLKNLRTGREWMWHPAGGKKLFRNVWGDDFSLSSLVGMDECLPTIAPCTWLGRELPDHGEVWSASWTVDRSGWEDGVLRTSVKLPVSPLEFSRTVEIEESEIRLCYKLRNLSSAPESFLWAMHPLLSLRPGDALELPTSTRALLKNEDWIDAVGAAIPVGNCAKAFASPVKEGMAAIINSVSGESLEFSWNTTENRILGIWLTRGGWHGHHHFALEPTNGAPDALEIAAASKHCGTVPACGFVTWQINLRIGCDFNRL